MGRGGHRPVAAGVRLWRRHGGARLTLRIGPFSGQPSELLKVILVVFLAGYLAENRQLLVRGQHQRVGPLRLPPLPYLLPMLAMWGIALAIVIVQSDLGAALLFFLVFLGLLYVATRRASYVVLGMGLFVLGGFVLYELVPRVQERIDIWLNPWADPQGAGYQIIRALYAYGRGGILGTGLGAGLAAGRRRSRRFRRSTPTSSLPASPRSWACSVRWPCSASTWSSPSAASASPRSRPTTSGHCWRPA